MSSSSMKDFQILLKLGSGSFSQVYQVRRHADQKEYALKKVELSQLKEKERQNALNEVRLLASLENEFIVAYKDAFIDEATSSLCIVMELLSGGDLQKRISQAVKENGPSFTEQEIWKAMVHMVKGLKSLHDVKVVHRDLKCANVFLSKDGKYKLGDLNVSKVAKMGLVYTQTGTPYYASPEVWRDEPYDSKSDIWSLGCVLYEMATLKPPFRANDMEGLFHKVQKGAYEGLPSKYSKDLCEILSQMLKVKPNQRPSCDMLLQNPLLARHAYDQLFTEPDPKSQLLQTIKLPKNVRALKEKLPKSKYDNKEINKTQERDKEFKIGSQLSDQSLNRNKSASINVQFFIKLQDTSSITPERYKSKIENVSNPVISNVSNIPIRRSNIGRPMQVSEYIPNDKSYSPINRSLVGQSSRPLSSIVPVNRQRNYSPNTPSIVNQKPVLYSQIHKIDRSVEKNSLSIEQSQSPIIKYSERQKPKESKRYVPYSAQPHLSQPYIFNSEPSQPTSSNPVPQKDLNKQSRYQKSNKEFSAREIIQNIFQAKATIRKSHEQPRIIRPQEILNKQSIRPLSKYEEIKIQRPLSTNNMPDHNRLKQLHDNKPQFNIITNSPYRHYYPYEQYQLKNQLSDHQLVKKKPIPLHEMQSHIQKYKLSEVQQYNGRKL